MSIPPELMAQLTGGNYPVPTGNLPVPTGRLPVPLSPIPMGPVPGQLALGAGPSHTPVSIRPNPALNILQSGGSVGTGAGFRPNLSGLPNVAGIGAQTGSFARTLASQAATKSNLLSKFTGGITGGMKPAFGKGNIIAGIAAPMAGNWLGEQAGGSESILGRFLQGAGMGGGLGAFLGPKGALVGGAIGGVANALFGDEGGGSEDFERKLDTVLSQGGFSPEDTTQVKLMYDLLKETKGEEAAKAQIGDIIMNDMMMREQAGLAQQDAQAKMLATQALTAQFFQPFTQQLLDSAQQRYAITEKVADDLPPAYQSVARAQNAASLDNANRVATAYASQAQLMPMLSAMQSQQGMANQLAQQQTAQGMAQLYGGGGGGGGSLADILAAQAG